MHQQISLNKKKEQLLDGVKMLNPSLNNTDRKHIADYRGIHLERSSKMYFAGYPPPPPLHLRQNPRVVELTLLST